MVFMPQNQKYQCSTKETFDLFIIEGMIEIGLVNKLVIKSNKD